MSQKTKDELLKSQILEVLSINPAYGHRRVAIELGIGKKRVRRVMKLYNIKPYKRKARWTKKRDLKRPKKIYQNQIKGSSPIKTNVVWASDFTRIKYQARVVYLATFMDLYTREVVGWNVSNRHTTNLVIEAFIDGFKAVGALPKIVHSDQGSEYGSKDYLGLMSSLGIIVSMSKRQSPWENAYQESFYNNFKTDLGLEFDRFNCLGELIVGIHQTINYYNKRRIHTSLKMSPEKYRLKYQNI